MSKWLSKSHLNIIFNFGMVVDDKLSTYQLSICAIIVMVSKFLPRLIPLPKNMGTYYILCNYNIFQGLNM